ncbi:helix-turn-helix domain-containing protein [Aquabacterium sp.]|uniref:helix-turn-helix domain-containing protein n=1 Tax=Aquabacterium sp. TaxID=1872578 RepID=UPI00263714A0|nr:helix-turn-helix domain-containing protein [Aquabacterium sp.]MDD2978061.1 helix-turn-helix domain-containing protein [Aquabacterium sp.]
MSASRRDNARGQAGEVGEANSSQRSDSISSDLFPESLPEPAASHHPHVSTTGEAQRKRILEMLRTGPKTTLDFRRSGAFQSPTRIHELRALGYDIATVGRVTVIDDQGYPHHGVALYELFAEPEASIRGVQS